MKSARGERRQRIELAYMTASLIRRQKKLPPLDSLLPKEPVVLSKQEVGERLLSLVPMLTAWGARKQVHKKKGKK